MTLVKTFIADLAKGLRAEGERLDGGQLAIILNAAGFRTSWGSTYDPRGRGVYRLIHLTYDALVAAGRQADADLVAEAFTLPDGRFAYAA